MGAGWRRLACPGLFGQDQPAQTRYLQAIDLALVLNVDAIATPEQLTTGQQRGPHGPGSASWFVLVVGVLHDFRSLRRSIHLLANTNATDSRLQPLSIDFP